MEDKVAEQNKLMYIEKSKPPAPPKQRKLNAMWTAAATSSAASQPSSDSGITVSRTASASTQSTAQSAASGESQITIDESFDKLKPLDMNNPKAVVITTITNTGVVDQQQSLYF